MSEVHHATAVIAIPPSRARFPAGAAGVLIRGPSGSGKSTLAAALLDRGAILVADDRVHLSACHGRLLATALHATAGLLELRGRGLARHSHERNAVIRLVIDIAPAETLDRMPEPGELTALLLGLTLPRQPVPADPFRAISLLEEALAACHRTAI